MAEGLLELIAEQTKAMQLLITQLAQQKVDVVPNNEQRTMDSLAKSITDFFYDPQSKVTFGTWYDRYEDAFTVDGASLTDAAKVRVLLRKLDSNCHSQYINFILPKKPSDNNFAQTVVILKRMFGRKMKSTLDMVKPKTKFGIVRNDKMESQFNAKHGAKCRIFYPNQKVYVRDFRDRKVVWCPAVIIERIGTVVYSVECESLIWRRHANQIRIRYVFENEDSDSTLSLLYDVFDTPTNNIQQFEPSPSVPSPRESLRETPLPEVQSRPQRNRRPPVRTDFSRSVNGRYMDA